MPIYEYKCKICLYIIDILHSIKEQPIIICDKCLKQGQYFTMNKVINTPPLMRMGVGHAWNGAQAEIDKMKKKPRKSMFKGEK